MSDAELRDAHAACVANLRAGESYAKPVPTTIDVQIFLARRRTIADRDDVQIRCRALALDLADS